MHAQTHTQAHTHMLDVCTAATPLTQTTNSTVYSPGTTLPLTCRRPSTAF